MVNDLLLVWLGEGWGRWSALSRGHRPLQGAVAALECKVQLSQHPGRAKLKAEVKMMRMKKRESGFLFPRVAFMPWPGCRQIS